jgi:hypothetical protein
MGATLVILLITSVSNFWDTGEIEYKSQTFKSGFTIDECMHMAADINSSATIGEGHASAFCAPTLYDGKTGKKLPNSGYDNVTSGQDRTGT